MISRARDLVLMAGAGLTLILGVLAAPAETVPQWLVASALLLGWVLTAWALLEVGLPALSDAWCAVDDLRAKPRLGFAAAYANDIRLPKTSRQANVLRIRVFNHSPRPQGDAIQVFATIRASGPTGPIEIPARCSTSNWCAIDGGEERIEIPAGQSRDFDVALRFHGDQAAYLTNTENLFQYGGRNPGWRMPPGEYLVEISVSHSKGSQRYAFRIVILARGPVARLSSRVEDYRAA